MLNPPSFRRFLPKTVSIIRNKHKDTHWSVLKKKVHPINKALDHFDDFYKEVYKHEWNSIRQGLLGKPKYIAVVNNYGDVEETVSLLERLGALNVRTLFNLEKPHGKTKPPQTTVETDEQTDILTNPPQITPRNLSLEASLNTAEYDVERVIHTSDSDQISLGQFVPADRIKGKDDWIPESDYYKYYDAQAKVAVKCEHDLHFPEHLQVYCFEEKNLSNYPQPNRSVTGVYNYYLMDGGSLLPVLALDIKPGQRLLDMCAAPGGKALLAIQTLYPKFVSCNDISWMRTRRIYGVFNQYLYDLSERWIKASRLNITYGSGVLTTGDFDRILVDVPCTTDRLSVTKNEDNLFKSNRIKERLRLPETQCDLLVHALKLVRVGGIVVYSTCSLSPIQNDGVVDMALKIIAKETNIKVVVKNMGQALAQTNKVYKLAEDGLTRYGSLVLPCLGQNYGPSYFCKLQKIR